MASIAELEDCVASLEAFHRRIGERIEHARSVRDPVARSTIIKDIQTQLFEMSLKMPFGLMPKKPS